MARRDKHLKCFVIFMDCGLIMDEFLLCVEVKLNIEYTIYSGLLSNVAPYLTKCAKNSVSVGLIKGSL